MKTIAKYESESELSQLRLNIFHMSNAHCALRPQRASWSKRFDVKSHCKSMRSVSSRLRNNKRVLTFKQCAREQRALQYVTYGALPMMEWRSRTTLSRGWSPDRHI